MESLNELFDKAKNIQPPLDKSEVEKLILEAKPSIKKAPKNNFTPKKLLIFSSSLLVVGTSLAIWYASENNIEQTVPPTINNTSKSTSPEINSPQKITQKENNPSNTTVNTPTASNDVPSKSNISYKNSYTPKTSKGALSINSITETPPAPPSENKPFSDKENTTSNNQPETNNKLAENNNTPITDSSFFNTIDREQDTVPTLASIDTESIDTDNEAKEGPTDSIIEHMKALVMPDSLKQKFKRFFIKTDALGYMYNNILKGAFFTKNFPNKYDIIGNKVSLGLEYRLTKRISIGCNISYGTMLNIEREFSQGASNTNTLFNYINYKGLVTDFEMRYYLYNGKYSSLFMNPYFAYGNLQERVFYASGKNSSITDYYTIGTTKGKSYGFGLGVGYKFLFRSFFIEPSIGLTIIGSDRGYSNNISAFQSTVAFAPGRYRNNLSRVELSIGYAF